jgi:hypothetical protein
MLFNKRAIDRQEERKRWKTQKKIDKKLALIRDKNKKAYYKYLNDETYNRMESILNRNKCEEDAQIREGINKQREIHLGTKKAINWEPLIKRLMHKNNRIFENNPEANFIMELSEIQELAREAARVKDQEVEWSR